MHTAKIARTATIVFEHYSHEKNVRGGFTYQRSRHVLDVNI